MRPRKPPAPYQAQAQAPAPNAIGAADAVNAANALGAQGGADAADAANAIAALPNLGPKSAAMLQAAGICQISQLRRLGAVEAYARVKATQSGASLNLLWALEGALSGQPWQVVARVHRASLLLALEDAIGRHQSKLGAD